MHTELTELGEISGAALQQYLECARRRHHVDTATALQKAAIPIADATNPEARIPGSKLQNLLVHLSDLTQDALFGLHTSAFIQPESYSVMGYIAMNSHSIADAVARTMEYEKLVGDMGTTHLEAQPDGNLLVRWQCRYTHPEVRRHLVENVLASWVRYCRWMANSDASAERVLLEHSAPADPGLLAEYTAIFACPVLFAQPCSGLVVSPTVLAMRPRQPDRALLNALITHASEKLAAMGEISLTYRVREAIRLALVNGLPRKELIADALQMNTRTLHRKLQDEGTSYQVLLDDLRRSQAMQLLTSTNDTQAAIAERVGFSDVRSFQHAFKKWAHMTPGEFRDMFRHIEA